MRSWQRIEKKLAYLDSLLEDEGEGEDWQPNAGPQSLAYHSLADELLYGGSPGGGKTDLLMGLARVHARVLLLRRQLNQTGFLRQRAIEVLGAAALDRVKVGGCNREGDRVKYKGRPHDLYGFDEITEFTESQYRYIKTWNRTAIPGQRCRVVATSNPPETNEGRWILSYWAPWLDPRHPNPALAGELRYYLGDTEVDSSEPVRRNGKLVTPRSRTFIPSSIEDNPYLLATGYDQLLLNLTGSQASLTGAFADSILDHPYQVLPSAWVEDAQSRWVSEAPGPQQILAADVSRGGTDQVAVAVRHGYWLNVYTCPGKQIPDGQAAAQFILQYWRDNSEIVVDVNGVGAAAYDLLRDWGYRVRAFNGANAAHDRDRTGQFGFRNLRAASYWNLRDALDPVLAEPWQLPPGGQVLGDLVASRYFLTRQGIQIESKDEIRARLGRSPDIADAITMALHPGSQMPFRFG